MYDLVVSKREIEEKIYSKQQVLGFSESLLEDISF